MDYLLTNKKLELKAYCSDPKGVHDICIAHEAKLIRSNNLKDTYFSIANGRLKLRQVKGFGNFLIYYFRANSPTLRENSYETVPIDKNVEDIYRIMEKAIGIQTIIYKKRDTYEWDSSLINIDMVKDLGYFIEIEIDVNPTGSHKKAFNVAENLLNMLNIKQIDIIPWSYAELKLMRDTASFWRKKLKFESNNRVGTLFLLDGASCSGKTTLAYKLIEDKDLNLKFVPRYSTRKPRQNETLESEYIFVSHREFTNFARTGAFIEYRDFKFGMSYGLPWKLVTDILLSGMDGLGIMDLGNIRHVKNNFPEVITILVLAPVETIRRRLIDRGVNTDDQIEERLENAKKVEMYKSAYDYVVNNDDELFDQALSSVKNIILNNKSKG